jgi:hypothetical protein
MTVPMVRNKRLEKKENQRNAAGPGISILPQAD